MLNSLWLTIPVSVLLGFLSGLGTGGGSLLILWLTLVLDLPQHTARAVNLMFFIPAAIIACLYHRKRNLPDIQSLLPGIIAGCIAAGTISAFVSGPAPEILRKAFGVLLLYTGMREIFYKKKSR